MTAYASPLCRVHVITEYACSNGGVSSRHEYLDLYPTHTPVSAIDPEKLDQAVRIAARELGSGITYNVQPVLPCPAGNIGYMAGGSFVTGDSRFSEEAKRVGGVSFYGAMALHDRTETTEQYRSNSI